MKIYTAILSFVLLIQVSVYSQNNGLNLSKINKVGNATYAVIENKQKLYLRSGFIFNVYSNNKKIGKLEVDSVNIERAFGYINLSPSITDYNSIIKDHELVLFKSYFISLNYIYKLSISDPKDTFQEVSVGFDFYPSFSRYRKQGNVWIGADVGYLFGSIHINSTDTSYSGLGHLFVKLEIGHSPFYKTKPHRGFMYGISIRPHIVKFYINEYYGSAEDNSNDTYLYIKNNANIFLGYQFSVFEFRAEISMNKMEVDKKYFEAMNTLNLRLGISF